MKAIIDGLLYDTDQARELASYTNGAPKGNFHRYSERLFRTENGRLFLAGEGGPSSKYAKSVGGPQGGRTGGAEIIPLSEYEAQQWVEKHCAAGTYLDIFGEEAVEAA